MKLKVYELALEPGFWQLSTYDKGAFLAACAIAVPVPTRFLRRTELVFSLEGLRERLGARRPRVFDVVKRLLGAGLIQTRETNGETSAFKVKVYVVPDRWYR